MVLVTAEVKLFEGKVDSFLEFLKEPECLPATKVAKGCNSVKVFIDESRNSVFLIEDWDSHDDYTNYIESRKKNGNVGKVTSQFGEFEFRFLNERAADISFSNK